MSTLETEKIEPTSGTTLTLGASGDVVTAPAGVTVKTNTVKDAGGNTLWTSNGSGTLSSVNSGLQGGLTLISSATASSSSSIVFSSGIDSTYDEYQIWWVDVKPATAQAAFQFQVNASGQSGFNETMTTTFWYSAADEGAGSVAAFAPTYVTSYDLGQATGYQTISKTLDNESDSSSVGQLHLFSPSSTSKVTHFHSRAHGMEDSNPESYASQNYASGYINTTAAITAISFQMSSGNISTGNLYLFGVK